MLFGPNIMSISSRLLFMADRAVARVEDAFNSVAGFFILALMFLMVAEVLGRRLFNSPIRGTIDMIEVGMVAFALLGIAFCQRHGTHVRMDIVLMRLPGRIKWAAEAIATSVALFYVSVITYQSFQHFLRAYQIGDSTIDTQIVLWPSKLVVPMALALLTLRLLVQLFGYFRMFGTPGAEPIGIPAVKDVSGKAAEEVEDVFGRSIADRGEQKRPSGE